MNKDVRYCTLFSFTMVLSHWVFSGKVFNEAVSWTSKGEYYEQYYGCL